jgi:hypothetical protein
MFLATQLVGQRNYIGDMDVRFRPQWKELLASAIDERRLQAGPLCAGDVPSMRCN